MDEMFWNKRDNEVAYSYDKYVEPSFEIEPEQDLYEEYLIKKGETMERKIINIKDITFDDLEKLTDYVWKGEYLIPAELIEGE